MEQRELTCIGCPMGCQITVTLEGQEIQKVEGNTCKIGDKYARNEVLHPERTVTSTVVITGGEKPRVSVKTKSDIPKDKIWLCMKEINAARAVSPVHIGDVIIPDVAGTGIPVIATKNVEAE